MGIFDKRISKKTNVSTSENEILPASEKGYLGEIEQFVNVVIAGLEGENYSDMNQQLSNRVSIDESKEKYVFEYPHIVGAFVDLIICFAFTLMYIYFLFIGVTTSFFSKQFLTLGVVGTTVSLVVLFVNICLIARFISTIKHKVRFDIYEELLGSKSLEFIEDIVICSKQNESTVIRDLQKAIKQKLIPQGHFSRDNLVFMVSNKVYDEYMGKPAVYDRYFQKKIEDRKRVESRTKYINEIMEKGEQSIKKLNDFRILIKDKAVAKKVQRLVNVVSMIFHEIDVNPSQAQSLGVFLNYYLPTTERLLDTYESITDKKASVQNISKAKNEIEEALNIIIISFEGVLEKLYEEYEMDISSEIDALEVIMKEEGLIK